MDRTQVKEKIQELLDKLVGAHTTADRQSLAAEIMAVLDKPLHYLEKAVEARLSAFINARVNLRIEKAPVEETPAPEVPAASEPVEEAPKQTEEPAEADVAKVSDHQPVEHGA